MSPWGHHAVGIAIAAAGAWGLGFGGGGDLVANPIPLSWALGAVLGARAPDKLEIARWSDWTGRRHSVIPHRTLTHWPPLWAAVFALAVWLLMQASDDVGILFGWAVIGFAVSGLVHLALDILTPSGIPLGNPFGKRKAFPLYVSGSLAEVPIVIGLAAVCYLIALGVV